MYIISLLSKFTPGPFKKYPHREKTTSFLTPPISWIQEWTESQIIPNMALGVWIHGYFAIRLTVSQYGRLNG